MDDLEQGQRSYLGVYFILAFGWAWSFGVPLSHEANGNIDIPPALSGFLMEGKPAAWGPLIAAVFVAALAGGKDELRRLFSSMVRVRFSVVWYLLAALLLPTLVGVAQGIAWIMGDTIAPSEAFANPMSISISFVWIFFLGGPLQEEAGWRGTATPALEARLGALGASLLVG